MAEAEQKPSGALAERSTRACRYELLGQNYRKPPRDYSVSDHHLRPAEASGGMAVGACREMLRANVAEPAAEPKGPAPRASARVVGDGGQRSGE